MTEKNTNCPLCGGGGYVCVRTLSYGPRLLACSNCKLHFVSPLPSLDSNFYDQDYYSSWGMKGNVLPKLVRHLKEANMRKHVKRIKEFVQEGNILEIGCAMGSFLKVALEEGFKGTGIDLSYQACEIAKKEVPGAEIFQGTLETVSFEPESFDIIFMSDVIEHVSDPHHFLRELYKLLKNNGFIYIITPDPKHWSCALAGKHWVHFKPEHLVFFPKVTLGWACGKLGLNFIEFSHILKYTTLGYCLAQTRQFGPKALALFLSMISSICPKRLEERLFPLPLGEARCVLSKSIQSKEI